MSEMLMKEFERFLAKVTPEMMKEKEEAFEAYMSRQYNGKPWRRLTVEEIRALDDADFNRQLDDLARIAAIPKEPEIIMVNGEEVVMEYDSREVQANEQFIVGIGGDIGGPDGKALVTEEDWAEFGKKVDKEKERLKNGLIMSPPRTAKYLSIFKKKFPNKTDKEIMAGFVLSNNGVATQDYLDMQERQEKSHVRSGGRRLTKAEVAKRELETGPENTKALAYADPIATMKVQEAIFHNSGVDPDNVKKMMLRGIGNGPETNAFAQAAAKKKEERDAYIERMKFEVMEDDGFVPHDDLIDPAEYLKNGDYKEMPVEELTQQQKESLKVTDIVRHIPPKEEQANG